MKHLQQITNPAIEKLVKKVNVAKLTSLSLGVRNTNQIVSIVGTPEECIEFHKMAKDIANFRFLGSRKDVIVSVEEDETADQGSEEGFRKKKKKKKKIVGVLWYEIIEDDLIFPNDLFEQPVIAVMPTEPD